MRGTARRSEALLVGLLANPVRELVAVGIDDADRAVKIERERRHRLEVAVKENAVQPARVDLRRHAP